MANKGELVMGLKKKEQNQKKQLSDCRFCGSNTVPPEIIQMYGGLEVDFSLALSQVS